MTSPFPLQSDHPELLDEMLKLPKSDPRRFVYFYGSRPASINHTVTDMAEAAAKFTEVSSNLAQAFQGLSEHAQAAAKALEGFARTYDADSPSKHRYTRLDFKPVERIDGVYYCPGCNASADDAGLPSIGCPCATHSNSMGSLSLADVNAYLEETT